MTYIVEVVAPIITYVEVIFLQNFSLLFSAIWAMPICDMDHQGNLLRVIILTLDLILRLQSVVLGKINNKKYNTTGKCISAYSKLLILPSGQVDMLNILMCLFNKFLDKVTNFYLVTEN